MSILLLWLTTLRVAIGIVALFFASPGFSSVHATCEIAYEEVTAQRFKYEDCVAREMSVCDRELESAHLVEKRRSDAALLNNAALLDQMAHRNAQCEGAVADGADVLKEWSVAGGSNAVLYSPYCSEEELAWLQQELSDASDIKSGGMAALRSYVAAVDGTMGRVSTYSRDLNRYNAQYLRNHSEDLSSSVGKVKIDSDAAAADALGRVDAVLEALVESSDRLIDCIGLTNTSTAQDRRRCVSGRGMYDLYLDLISMMEIQKHVIQVNIQSFNEVVDNYVSDVQDAISAANSFYDSINGARGLMHHLVKDLSLFGSSSELCGKTTPNWCSFSKVSSLC